MTSIRWTEEGLPKKKQDYERGENWKQGGEANKPGHFLTSYVVGPQEEWNTQCECEEGREGCRPTNPPTERATERRSTNSIIRGREGKEGREEEKAAKIPLSPFLPLFPIRNQSAIARPPPSPFPPLNLNCDQWRSSISLQLLLLSSSLSSRFC